MAFERFLRWLDASTPKDKMELMKRAGGSVQTLYQYVTEGTGRRYPSVEKARAMEEASRSMAKQSRGRLPFFTCGDFDNSCKDCRHYQASRFSKDEEFK